MEDRDSMLSKPDIRAEVRRDLMKLEAVINNHEKPGNRTLKAYYGMIKANRILLGLARICLTEIDALQGIEPETPDDMDAEFKDLLEGNQ